MRRILAVSVLALAHATAAIAQQGRPLAPGDRSIGASAEASFYLNGGARFAELRDRNLLMTGARAEWVLEAAGPFAVATTMEVLPLIVVKRRGTSLEDCWSSPNGQRRCQTEEPGTTYGAGIVPFGFKLYFANRTDFRVFGSGAAGLVLFQRDMPVAGSRRLNFLIEYGVGTEISRSAHTSLVVGWKFQHMSNAYTSLLNPGLDANALYLGVLLRRGARR